MKERLTIVVGGFIGLYPTGGVTWDYIQYPLGLRLMGHDVYYIEDTVQYSRYQKNDRNWDDATDSINYLKETMEAFGFRDRWAYRDIASGGCYGMSLQRVREVCASADLFINISASTFLRDEYLAIPIRVLVDSDPMFTQIDYYQECFVKEYTNEYRMKYVVENHTHHCTFGENMGSPDCRIPAFGYHWQPTRQPICLGEWDPLSAVPSKMTFTTVMNWSVKQDLEFEGTTWGQKNIELKKIASLPAYHPHIRFEVMLAGAPPEVIKELTTKGWLVRNALEEVGGSETYQKYIYDSSAEFGVAKETYVKSRSGWFSCRSACYLAAGRPVIAQDTGWSKVLPSGEGLLAFDGLGSISEGVEAVSGNYAMHCKRAREIAEAYFDSRIVLNALLDYAASNPVIPQRSIERA